METKIEKTFKLTNFSPIGLKIVNYPVQFCSLCRGYLTEVCNICMENNSENCAVVNIDNTFYHDHCYKFMDCGKNKSKS